jgi:hypothetical protein
MSCNVEGVQFSSQAVGQTGLGPYGIGVSVSVHPNGIDWYTLEAAFANVSFTWRQDFTIEGANGDGFMNVGFYDDFGDFPDMIGFSFFGQDVPIVTGGWTFPVPVTFGAPGIIMFQGQGHCNSMDFEGCGSMESYVSDLTFTDSDGNPLAGAHLVAVPEISSVALLGTLVLPVLIGVRKFRTQRLRCG